MADLREYIGRGTQAGTKVGIWLQVVFFVQMGTGEFTALDAQTLTFSGKAELPFYKGPLSLSLKLLEGGVAELKVNNRAAKGTWKEEGRKLRVEARVGDKQQVLVLERGGKEDVETYLALSGTLPANVHLAPTGPAPAVA